MAQRPPQAVELPDPQDVPFAEMGEHLLQDWSLDSCPADDFLVHLPASGLPEGIKLEGQTLLLCAHAGVPNLRAGSLLYRARDEMKL